MLHRLSRQRGAFMAIMVILIVVLLAFTSLILDVGRVLILRSEMQNAVDAAAIAAAAELDTNADAQQRAMNAARNAFMLSSHFARIKELLGDITLPNSAFTFFCNIGSRYDPNADDPNVDLSVFCGNTTPFAGSGPDSKKYEATGDGDSHYVRVSLTPTGAAADHFTVDLIFFPLLKVIGATGVLEDLALAANALAGRGLYACNFPPMAICDPFEGSGGFEANMPVGGHIELKQQGSNQWIGGNFGFLTPEGGGGATDVAIFLADEGDNDCQPAVVTTKPGGMTNKAKSGVNTRFGIYDKDDDIYGNTFGAVVAPFKGGGAPAQWPAAPNVMNYPLDQTTLASDSRFGNGDWLCLDYWTAHHDPLDLPPVGCLNPTSGMTRWDIYNHEINNGLIPNIDEDGVPGVEPAVDGDSAGGVANRRRIYVAVLSCQALGLSGGKTTAVISDPDGFAEIFIIRPAEGPPNGKMWGEYIGWGEESDGNFHIDIQLYE